MDQQAQHLTGDGEATTPPYLLAESHYTSDSDDDPNVEKTKFRPRRGASVRARAIIANACGVRRTNPTPVVPSQHVKVEVEDAPEIISSRGFLQNVYEAVKRPLDSPRTITSEPVQTQKRRQEVFDCVLIPTSRAVKRPKKEDEGDLITRVGRNALHDSLPSLVFPDVAVSDVITKMKLWENKSKVKKKKNHPLLLPETIRSRIRYIGFDIQEQYFGIDRIKREAMVTRAFMSNVYGGSPQEAFPSIGKKKLKKHGMNDFMYMNTDFQPQAPEVPGAPGLWFNPNEKEDLGRHRVFTKINMKNPNNKWLYVGQYDVCVANPSFLSMQEWRAQSATLQSTWADAIANKGWGDWVCARILARRLYGREPYDHECEELVANGRYNVVTADEVQAAYHSGKELMYVWTMKCVGYDNAFQNDISQTYPKWVPPPPKTKEEKEAEALEREKRRMLKEQNKQHKAEEKQRKKVEQLSRQQNRSLRKRQSPANGTKKRRSSR